ncbi:MAG: hypothetical protein N2747_11300, partial [Chitinophagaceae bacterium]|nr:hypothetical protein [Chitinophagaceae bacterium]
MTQIFLYGAGGLGREMLSMINALPEYTPAGFIDDNLPEGTLVGGLRVVHLENLCNRKEAVVISIGDPITKLRLFERLQASSFYYPQLIHQRAVLQHGESVKVGEGSVICACSVITTDVLIGKHVLINLGCTIGHDVTIG